MAFLYELEGIYVQLQAMELDDETFNDTLESIDFEEDFAQSCEWFIKMQRNAEADAERFKAEKDAFAKKQKEAEARAERFKERVKEAMLLTNQQKVDTGLFKLSLRKTESVTVFDATKLTDDFLKVKVEPNKTEIKKAIKNGQVVSGAGLTEGRSLVVK
ncbi:TPA: siphovirus Gp157 family protein [Streptococcus suis]|nr:siphovirus Gp157 family protein [Streptococcus suis]HEM5379637.1 siphovirus Gp157 family protein [Streptococcus suis]